MTSCSFNSDELVVEFSTGQELVVKPGRGNAETQLIVYLDGISYAAVGSAKSNPDEDDEQ
jgi:hypothetical protein